MLQAGPYEYFAVNPDCAHPQEAVEFAVFMSQKISDYCYQNGLGLPVWDTEGQTSSELFQQALDEAEERWLYLTDLAERIEAQKKG